MFRLPHILVLISTGVLVCFLITVAVGLGENGYRAG